MPTESLHKFLALAGLVIGLGVPIYTFKFIFSIGEKIIETETEGEILQAKVKNFDKIQKALDGPIESKLKFFEELLEKPEDFVQTVTAAKLNIDEFIKTVFDTNKEHKDNYLHLNGLLMELSIANAQAKGKISAVKYLVVQSRRISWVCMISMLFGLSMSAYGFAKWYSIQEAIDAGIRKEASKK